MSLSSHINEKANLIWAIADKLTGVYKPHEYGEVILPLTVIRHWLRGYLQSGAEVSAGYGSFCTFRLPVHLQCHRRSLPRNELPAGKKCRDQRR